MTIQRQSRHPREIGSLKLMAVLDPRMSVEKAAGSSNGLDELATQLARGAQTSLANPSRLHGLRVEALFRAVVVALGNFRLLVDEDEGDCYFDDNDGPVKMPDYRLVDPRGRHRLVEVKAVAPNRHAHSMSEVEWRGLQRYGELTGASVAVAHYWAGFNEWTLVDLDRLQPLGLRRGVTFAEAVKWNEMHALGDQRIGTLPPVELRPSVDEVEVREHPQVANVVIRDVGLWAAGRRLTDDVECRIAYMLFAYGNWDVDMPADVDEAGRLVSFGIKAVPPEHAEETIRRQGVYIVGSLSSMYSAIFNAATLSDDGAVTNLDHEAEPGELGSVIPSDYFDRPGRILQLWVFEVEPADEPGGPERSGP